MLLCPTYNDSTEFYSDRQRLSVFKKGDKLEAAVKRKACFTQALSKKEIVT